MNSFTIGSKDFKLMKIHAFKQFHIVRRLAPILKDMVPVAVKLAKKKASEEEMLELLGPIMEGLSKLTDKDSEFVLLGLLQSAEMKNAAGGWSKVAIDSGIMFDDLELPMILHIAGRAFMYNLQGFFAALPQVSPGQE